MEMRTVAIIGAGPAGLVAARYLKSEGFTPIIFEQGNSVGGQWTGDPRYSGVWSSMRANVSRVTMAFSDLRHEPNTPVYPSNQTMHAYLERYAERFGLMSCVRLKTRVLNIDRNPAGNGWVVWSEREGEAPREERFANVVIATGRCRKPALPAVPGLETFSGAGRVSHAFSFRGQEHYRGQRVVVAGGNISAIDIASDLATAGAARVHIASRRQRYILNQIIAGVPGDHLLANRYCALEEETFGADRVATTLKEFIIRTSGSPEQFGARQPANSIWEAGVTSHQFFMPLVAEGSIETKTWIESVHGQTVRFTDGSVEEVDAIIFGTGYDLDLPYLSDGIRRTLGLDARHIDLHNWTFHPDLPGLAFVGIMELIGPQFPLLETQARWVAYVWSGARPEPSVEQMKKGVAAWRTRRGGPQAVSTHSLSRIFAREAGVEPDLYQWPQLVRALLFGPLSPISLRLNGRDSLAEAPELVAEDARVFGAVPSPVLSREQYSKLQELARAWRDNKFARFVEGLSSDANTSRPSEAPRESNFPLFEDRRVIPEGV
jgi:dimethylaniline monooxygenase (N-oxide forming)